MADFPQFRRYTHHKTWFKILSESEMEELKILGNSYNLIHFKAQTFVDRNLISDMILNLENNWEVITEEQFNSQLELCSKNFRLNPSI